MNMIELASFQEDEMKPLKINRHKLDIDFYENLLSPEYSQWLYDYLEKNVTWSTSITKTRRSNQTYGDAGLVYEIKFGGYAGKPINIVKRKVISWESLPILIQLRDLIGNVTGEKYNFCVIQRYPNGRVGVKPHRDKEMTKGTIISGLSLGSDRVLTMSPPSFIKSESVNINLTPGSLYVLKSPTNDYWTHCIETSNNDHPRISLTFRNVPKA